MTAQNEEDTPKIHTSDMSQTHRSRSTRAAPAFPQLMSTVNGTFELQEKKMCLMAVNAGGQSLTGV